MKQKGKHYPIKNVVGSSQLDGFISINRPDPGESWPLTVLQREELIGGNGNKAQSTSKDMNLGFSHRLGNLAILIITIGWIIELGTLGFLVYVWSGKGPSPGGGYATRLWRNIMLHDLASRTATLSSLVLRTAVDLQATVCTAMVAALMLEARDVQMANIALFSVLRAVNGGPSNVVQPLLSTPRKFLHSAPAFIVLILFMSTVASQFASTLLLSDFRQTSLFNDTTQGHIPVLETQPELLLPLTNSSGTSSLAWQQAMTSYPPFGEQTTQGLNSRLGLSEAGSVKRAFLPFQSRQRQNLRRYEGAAVTFESQVACTRPSLTGTVYAGSDRLKLPRIAGNLSWVSATDDPSLSGVDCDTLGRCEDIPFDCALPFNISGSNLQSILSKRPLSICLVGREPDNISFTRSFSNMFLALDTMSSADDWNNVIPGNIPGSTEQGEWASFDFDQNVQLRVTSCLSNATMRLENVTMEAADDLAEPSLNYDPSSGTWDTDEIIGLMGIMGGSQPEERGILNITRTAPISASDLEAMFESSPNFAVLSQAGTAEDLRDQFFSFLLSNVQGGILTAMGATNFSIYLCSGCNLSPNFTDIHPHYPILFGAILEQTGSIAPAWQSMLFWLAQAQYYNALSGFDFGNNSTMVFSQVVSLPQVWFGLASVTGIIILNIACVAITTWLFIRRTRYSVYGNSWHAIAQVVSPDTRHLLDRATQATDNQVKQSLREIGSDQVDAGLWKLESGRIAVVRRTSPFKNTEIE